jgi:hypothetical protein
LPTNSDIAAAKANKKALVRRLVAKKMREGKTTGRTAVIVRYAAIFRMGRRKKKVIRQKLLHLPPS